MPKVKMTRVHEAPPEKISERREGKIQLKGRMKNLLMFLPNMLLLCARLLKDSRVPLAEKALFAGAIVYVISPLDFIPDVLPFIGQVDDVYVVALTLLRLVNFTDENVVRQHWSGGGDIVSLANSIASLAPAFLPKRVSRMISSKVELADAGKVLKSVTKHNEPLIREIPQIELVEKKK